MLPPAAPLPERLLHTPGVFLPRVDHVSSFRLSPPWLAVFFGGSSVSHWREAYLWPLVALTHHQRWLPLPSPPGLYCWLFSFFLLLCFILGFSVVHSICLSLYWCLSSSNSSYILYHINWWPQFWHSCHELLGMHLWLHCHRVLSFVV